MNFVEEGWQNVGSKLFNPRSDRELALLRAIYICGCARALVRVAERVNEEARKEDSLSLSDVLMEINADIGTYEATCYMQRED